MKAPSLFSEPVFIVFEISTTLVKKKFARNKDIEESVLRREYIGATCNYTLLKERMPLSLKTMLLSSFREQLSDT